jgi:hypothetical protein
MVGVASNWVHSALRPPIVPSPGDYNDGEIGGTMIGRGNRITRREPPPSTALSTTNLTCLFGREAGGCRGGKSATNRLSYGTAWAS